MSSNGVWGKTFVAVVVCDAKGAMLAFNVPAVVHST
jgi:hypothetical protein